MTLPAENDEHREMRYCVLAMFDKDDLDQICCDAGVDIDIDDDTIISTNNFNFVAGAIAALTHVEGL